MIFLHFHPAPLLLLFIFFTYWVPLGYSQAAHAVGEVLAEREYFYVGGTYEQRKNGTHFMTGQM